MIEIVKKLFSTKLVERFKKKSKLLGVKNKVSYESVLVLYFFVVMSSALLSILLFYKKLYLIILVPAFVSFAFEYLYFDVRINSRKDRLNKDALFFFQILSLALTSGNNLKGAIELTTSSSNSELSLEFKKVISDINVGSTLDEALNDLRERIPCDVINNIILNLTEANIYGSNMIESLNTQLKYLNDKLLLDVRRRINQMPIKISIVSVLLFIPIVLLIILGPLVLKLIAS